MNLGRLQIFTLALFSSVTAQAAELLNVSYDPTREFYAEFNNSFADYWKQKTGENVKIKQSHGGSGKQARSVIDGLRADVVTLALSGDIDVISQQANLLPKNWQSKLPNNSAPYTSTIVFVVRKGNPKGIKDWGDLIRQDVKVITPNPKTSGGARWNYLAAWSYAKRKFKGNDQQILEFMRSLYANVPVLDTGARGSTTTFAQRGIGDVFLSWENEAHLIEKEFPGKTQIVIPSISILAEPPVAVVEKNTAKKGTTNLAEEYLKYLYTPQAQDIAGKHYYRPRDKKALAKWSSNFPKINMVTINEFGGWARAQQVHFNDGGTFDQIYK
jgi:sulfate transport system substrate-binding protein